MNPNAEYEYAQNLEDLQLRTVRDTYERIQEQRREFNKASLWFLRNTLPSTTEKPTSTWTETSTATTWTLGRNDTSRGTKRLRNGNKAIANLQFNPCYAILRSSDQLTNYTPRDKFSDEEINS